MKFKSEKCPDTFSSEDRICRGCWKVSSEDVLRVEGTDHAFAACPEFECQEAVKNLIMASLSANRKPLLARIFRHAFR